MTDTDQNAVVAEPELVASLEGAGATEHAYFSCLTHAGDAHYGKIDQLKSDAKPLYDGTIAEFVKANSHLTEQMRNVVKKCPDANCGRSVAGSLWFCNSCNADLTNAELKHTENVCMAFVYGIATNTNSFPLALSKRLDEPDTLVYDDMLARGSCHLNAIPTDCHLPDWRHLLRNPGKGIELMKRLEDRSWKVVREQFWGNDSWRQSMFKGDAFSSPEEFRRRINAGVNATPSQFQIHLQYIVPPFTPYDYNQFLHGKRLIPKRWLPVEYLLQALEAVKNTEEGCIPDAHKMNMDDIYKLIAKMKGGPDYDNAFAEAFRRADETHQMCANWQSQHFEVVTIVDGIGEPTGLRQLRSAPYEVAEGSKTPSDLMKSDVMSIQSYGRPYDADGKPTARTYYSTPRKVGEVKSADEWADGD